MIMPEKSRLTSRQLQAKKTQRRIFNAAFGLLHKMDIKGVKITDILDAAGVSPGTFYHYYKSKWDVFYESHRFLDDYFEQEVSSKLTQPDIIDRLLYFFNQYIVYHAQTADALQYLRIILNMDNPVFTRSLYSAYDYGLMHVLRETIQQGIDAHQLSNTESSVEIAAFLMIAFRGLLFDWCVRDGSYDISSALNSYIPRLLCAFMP